MVDVVPFFVTYDAFPECRSGSDFAKLFFAGWRPTAQDSDADGDIAVWRESPFSPDEHELAYLNFDDDGNLCAAGTCTDRDYLNAQGSYMADQHHMADCGGVHTFFWNRATGQWLGRLYC